MVNLVKYWEGKKILKGELCLSVGDVCVTSAFWAVGQLIEGFPMIGCKVSNVHYDYYDYDDKFYGPAMSPH